MIWNIKRGRSKHNNLDPLSVSKTRTNQKKGGKTLIEYSLTYSQHYITPPHRSNTTK